MDRHVPPLNTTYNPCATRMPNDLQGVLERVIATVQATLRRTHAEGGPGAELRLIQSKEDIERWVGMCMHRQAPTHEPHSAPFVADQRVPSLLLCMCVWAGQPSSTAPRGCTGTKRGSRASSSIWTAR